MEVNCGKGSKRLLSRQFYSSLAFCTLFRIASKQLTAWHFRLSCFPLQLDVLGSHDSAFPST